MGQAANIPVAGVVQACESGRHLPRPYTFGRQLGRIVRVELGERCAKVLGVEGDTFEIDGWKVEVIDMDGKRIDKLLFVPVDQARAGQ